MPQTPPKTNDHRLLQTAMALRSRSTSKTGNSRRNASRISSSEPRSAFCSRPSASSRSICVFRTETHRPSLVHRTALRVRLGITDMSRYTYELDRLQDRLNTFRHRSNKTWIFHLNIHILCNTVSNYSFNPIIFDFNKSATWLIVRLFRLSHFISLTIVYIQLL